MIDKVAAALKPPGASLRRSPVGRRGARQGRRPGGALWHAHVSYAPTDMMSDRR
jgi:hypothetical protein